MSRLWGGAHTSSDDDAVAFASSSDVSYREAPENAIVVHDIATNLAHAKALRQAGLLTSEEHKAIEKELSKLKESHESGQFVFDPSFEDIHSQIESKLTETIGESGKKIHTGRSRNDQVTTDMFLYSREHANEMLQQILDLVSVLETLSRQHQNTICPGYTHYQKAVVTSFGEILEAYATMFSRDAQRIKDVISLFDYSPLGAATGYESLMAVDPGIAAKELNFSESYKNSIDVITTRGEFEGSLAHALSMFATHASMLAQTLIVFSSQAYGFITLDDAYTTGSSVMPQKKNPDILEIVKAKSVLVQSLSSSLQNLLQSAYVGFNRDSQYSKKIIVDVVNEVARIPEFLSAIVSTMHVNKASMKTAASKDFVTSTGLMELIVQNKGIALRDAKQLIEKAVAFSDIVDGTISFDAFQKAANEMQVDVDLTENVLKEWQDPTYQLDVRRRRFGV